MTSLSDDVTNASVTTAMATEIPPELKAQIDYLDNITNWLWYISMPILLALGTTGNALVVVVLTVRRLKPYPTSLLLTFLSVFDTTVLWTGPFRRFYIAVTKHDFRSDSFAACSLHVFMTYLSLSLSIWTLVTVTVHRLIAVYFPLQAKTILTPRRTVQGLIAMAVLLAAINSHLFWTVHLSDEGKCENRHEHKYLVNNIWPRLDLIVNSIIPFFVLLVCNSTIIYKVKVKSDLLTKDVKSATNKTNTMTVMLISVNIIFLLTTAPFAIYNCDVWLPKTKLEKYSIDFMIFTIVYIIQCINNASNFYIYCLSGRKFREEFKATFSGKRVGRQSTYERSQGMSVASASVAETGTKGRVWTTSGRNAATATKNGHDNPACIVRDSSSTNL